MTARLVALCIDANDPHQLARFWSNALGWEIGKEGEDTLDLTSTDASFEVVFRKVPNEKASQNRVHLDLTTESIDDQNDTVARLVEIGARHVDIGQSADEGHVVLADPEGNEFCVIEPGNTFLAGCGRLGSINCDGTQALGYFWSEALGWPLVWDQDEETAIRASDRTGPLITWSGPPLMPRIGHQRFRLDIAAPAGESQRAEADRLVRLGASRTDIGAGASDAVRMVDPDGNEFRVLATG